MLGMKLPAPRRPLAPIRCEDPDPGPGEVRLRAQACGVCRTDLHIADGELALRPGGVIPGHQVVGVVDAVGSDVHDVRPGDRLGVPWLGGACGACRYCKAGRENLCDDPTFTGFTRDGGFADTVVARAAFCIPLPAGIPDHEAAPLLCAGLIGFRAWRMAFEGGDVERANAGRGSARQGCAPPGAQRSAAATPALTRRADPARRLPRRLSRSTSLESSE